jgi:hypothetical protein
LDQSLLAYAFCSGLGSLLRHFCRSRPGSPVTQVKWYQTPSPMSTPLVVLKVNELEAGEKTWLGFTSGFSVAFQYLHNPSGAIAQTHIHTQGVRARSVFPKKLAHGGYCGPAAVLAVVQSMHS